MRNKCLLKLSVPPVKPCKLGANFYSHKFNKLLIRYFQIIIKEMRRRAKQLDQDRYKEYIHRLIPLIKLIEEDSAELEMCSYATSRPEDSYCSFRFTQNNPDGATLSQIASVLEETSMNIHNVIEKSINKMKPKLIAEGLLAPDERDLGDYDTPYKISNDFKGE